MDLDKTLVKNIFDLKSLKQEPTRNGFGRGLMKVGELDDQVVVLSADLTESTRVLDFKNKFPERFVEVGVAEQNMAGVAAGMALEGKIPFMASYAVFSPGRNWDQVRVSICYSKTNVKIVGAHAGLSVGPDGATHQALEDIAIIRVLPNMIVVVPADSVEAEKATLAIAKYEGPAYIRLGRSDLPIFTTELSAFEIGKANVLKEGSDITIIACGAMVYKSLEAAKDLEAQGVSAEVINLHTIKPLDTKTILKSVKKTGKLVTVEEHQIHGGMGSAVVEFTSQNHPVPTKIIGVEDTFGESGTPDELFEKYGLTSQRIVVEALELIGKRKLNTKL
jgi:transketolase